MIQNMVYGKTINTELFQTKDNNFFLDLFLIVSSSTYSGIIQFPVFFSDSSQAIFTPDTVCMI